MVIAVKNSFKYLELKKHLIGMIASGQYPSGFCIESENELGSQFKLSRNTVRQAIKELEVEGYLYRVQGKGTFVKETNPSSLRKIALIIYDTAYMLHPITASLIRGIDEVSGGKSLCFGRAGQQAWFSGGKSCASLGKLFGNFNRGITA